MANEAYWFLNTLVCIPVAAAHGNDGISVLDHRAPAGDSPPLHLHEREDEIFVVMEGRFRFQVDGNQTLAGPGTVLLVPKGVAHTYRVESPEGGRFLTITAKRDFEQFVRALGRPADREELPPPQPPPPPQAVEQLAAVAKDFGIRLVGPPLT